MVQVRVPSMDTTGALIGAAGAWVQGRADDAESEAKGHADTGDAELRADMPQQEPDHETYAAVTVDEAGKITEATKWDGTKHIPKLSTDADLSPFVSRVRREQRILIVAGQSNALWKFNTDGPKLAEPDDRVKWWNRIAETETVVSPNVTPSIASEFARQYVRDNAGVEVLIVPVTAGSTGFSTSSISPAPEGYLYASGGTWDRTLTADPNNLPIRLRDSLAGALDSTGGAEIIGMLWSQGESDRTRKTEATYGAALDDLLGWLRTESGQDFPVVLGSMTPDEIAAPQFAGTEGILRALEGTQARLFKTAYVWGPENHQEYLEQIHWSPEGNRDRAVRMSQDGLRQARLNLSGGKPYSPRNIRYRAVGTDVEILWDYPLGRTTSVTLETSTDGTTWTAETLAGPLVRSHRRAYAPGLRVRMRATNETGNSAWTLPIALDGVIRDTGWRKVTPAGTVSGNIFLRRKGDEVHLMMQGVSVSTGGHVTVYDLPAGFEAQPITGANWRNGTVVDDDGTSVRTTSYYAGNMRILNMEASKGYGGYINWITNDAWPAALPGTAA